MKKTETIEVSLQNELVYNILIETGNKLKYKLLDDQKSYIKWRSGIPVIETSYTVEVILKKKGMGSSLTISVFFSALWDPWGYSDRWLKKFITAFNNTKDDYTPSIFQSKVENNFSQTRSSTSAKESSIPFKGEREDDNASPIIPKDGAGIR